MINKGLNRKGLSELSFAGGGMVDTLAYWRRARNTFGSSLILATPLNENSGTVVLDRSGKGNNGTYINSPSLAATLAPPYVGGMCPIFNGSNQYVELGGSDFKSDFDGREGAVRIPLKIGDGSYWNTNNYTGFLFQNTDTNNRIFLRTYNGTGGDFGFSVYYIAGGTTKFWLENKMSNFSDWLDIWLSWSSSGDSLDLYVNGLPIEWKKNVGQTASQSGLGLFASGSLTSSLIGWGYTPWIGSISGVLALNRPVEEAEVREMNPSPVLLFDGDSRTNAKTYPFEAFGESTKTYYGFKHLGTSGAGLSTLTNNAPGNVDPFIHGNGSICVIWAGVNDSGQTAQQIHDAIKTYCLARKSAGWKVVVCTEIDAQDAGRITNGWPAKYLTLNTLLRADYTDFADGLADLGANANLQDATNVTYFDADNVHLTSAGYTVVANIVGEVLASI